MESLIVALACAAAYGFAAYAYRNGRPVWALGGILLGGLILRLFAGADGYLHEWDEKYHALVAKNLLAHPLRPTLFDHPVLAYDYRAWCCNSVWLGKPPLPLWLMAGSMGLFGPEIWAVRLPSLLLSLLAVGLTFQLGKRLFDTNVGLLAAFLHSVNGKLIELAAGRDSSDHVETCHIVLFQVAMWFVFKNWQTRSRGASAMAVGLFAGLAFMSKWTPAFLIPLIWLPGALWQGLLFRRVLITGARIGLVFAAVCTPWVWYIYTHFPQESRWLWQIMTSYKGSVVEGHSGPWYFYLDKARIMFGELVYAPMLLGMIAICRRPAWGPLAGIALWMALPLLIFSASATKRDTYLLVTAPAFFLLTAWLLRGLLLAYHGRPSRRRWYAALIFLLLALPLRYGAERTKLFVRRERRPVWMEQIDRFRQSLATPPERMLVFGVEHNIEMMFHTGVTAYAVVPAPAELDSLKNAGYTVLLPDGAGLHPY